MLGFNLDKRAGQGVQEANPPNEHWRLAKKKGLQVMQMWWCAPCWSITIPDDAETGSV